MFGTPVTLNYKVDIVPTTGGKNLGNQRPAAEGAAVLFESANVLVCETYTLYNDALQVVEYVRRFCGGCVRTRRDVAPN